jgi:hypothetical protein
MGYDEPEFLRSSNRTICLSIADGEHPRTTASFRRKALFLAKLEMTVVGVRRDKAAFSSGCKSHPANRSSRKQPEQLTWG